MLSLSDSIFMAFRKNFSVIFIDTFSPSFLTFVKKYYTAHFIKISMDKKTCFKYKISTDKNKQIYFFSIFSLFFSIDVLIFPTRVGTEGRVFHLRKLSFYCFCLIFIY